MGAAALSSACSGETCRSCCCCASCSGWRRVGDGLQVPLLELVPVLVVVVVLVGVSLLV